MALLLWICKIVNAIDNMALHENISIKKVIAPGIVIDNPRVCVHVLLFQTVMLKSYKTLVAAH